MLFCLSLVPFATGWLGENSFAALPAALYGLVLLLAGLAYWVMQGAIIRHQGAGSVLASAVGQDFKGKLSLVLYVIAIAAAFVRPWIALLIYALVACFWLVPDPRIERVVGQRTGASHGERG